MRKISWFSLIVIVCCQNTNAQTDTLDSKKESHQHFLSQTVIPAPFIMGGIMLTNTITEKNLQTDIRNQVGNDYHNGMDDYIQYAPYAEIYLGDVLGIKAKNHWFDQTKNIVITGFITGVIVQSLKIGVGKERPDGTSHNSFPSGHTTNSFAGDNYPVS